MGSLIKLKRLAIRELFLTPLGRVCLVLIVALFLVACESPVKKRPVGYLRLGKVSDFKGEENFLPRLRVVLKRDDRGWYVMSTMCTHDLTPLVPQRVEGKTILASQYSSSTYDMDGNVLSGPSVGDLPYYALELSSDRYGSEQPNTLYARVGVEVSPDWRLPYP